MPLWWRNPNSVIPSVSQTWSVHFVILFSGCVPMDIESVNRCFTCVCDISTSIFQSEVYLFIQFMEELKWISSLIRIHKNIRILPLMSYGPLGPIKRDLLEIKGKCCISKLRYYFALFINIGQIGDTIWIIKTFSFQHNIHSMLHFWTFC